MENECKLWNLSCLSVRRSFVCSKLVNLPAVLRQKSHPSSFLHEENWGQYSNPILSEPPNKVHCMVALNVNDGHVFFRRVTNIRAFLRSQEYGTQTEGSRLFGIDNGISFRRVQSNSLKASGVGAFSGGGREIGPKSLRVDNTNNTPCPCFRSGDYGVSEASTSLKDRAEWFTLNQTDGYVIRIWPRVALVRLPVLPPSRSGPAVGVLHARSSINSNGYRIKENFCELLSEGQHLKLNIIDTPSSKSKNRWVVSLEKQMLSDLKHKPERLLRVDERINVGKELENSGFTCQKSKISRSDFNSDIRNGKDPDLLLDGDKLNTPPIEFLPNEDYGRGYDRVFSRRKLSSRRNRNSNQKFVSCSEIRMSKPVISVAVNTEPCITKGEDDNNEIGRRSMQKPAIQETELVAQSCEDNLRFSFHQRRPAVVCVLGHVNHGKTTLLKALRLLANVEEAASNTKGTNRNDIVADEAGGITQQIRFFQIQRNGIDKTDEASKLVLFDTPGHTAFQKMRLRAAACADIGLLVVAADEGIMEETRKSIMVCQELQLPIIVTVTKVDKALMKERYAAYKVSDVLGSSFFSSASGVKLLDEFASFGVVADFRGGDVQFTAVDARGFISRASAKNDSDTDDAYGLVDLVDRLDLQADIINPTANHNDQAQGVVLEVRNDKGLGASAFILLNAGTIKAGEYLVAGGSWCKAREVRSGETAYGDSDVSFHEHKLGPSSVVQVFGFDSQNLPGLASKVVAVSDEKTAQRLARKFQEARKSRDSAAASAAWWQRHTMTLKSDGSKVAVLPVVIRAETLGKAEAVAAMAREIVYQKEPKEFNEDGLNAHEIGLNNSREISVKRASSGVCTEEDVKLCVKDDGKGGVLVAFSSKVPSKVQKLADECGVGIFRCEVIYEAIEFLKQKIQSNKFLSNNNYINSTTKRDRLGSEFHELGEACVKMLFKLRDGTVVAGCHVSKGRLCIRSTVAVKRGKIVVLHKGQIASLKVGKEVKDQVKSAEDCGVIIDNFNDWKIGDTITACQ